MGTYDTRGGHAASPDDPVIAPSELVERVLELLELREVPTPYNDRIVAVLEEYEAAERADCEAALQRLHARHANGESEVK